MKRAALLALAVAIPVLTQKAPSYFPPAGEWKRVAPAEAGMDATILAEAVALAKAGGSTWDFAKDQVRTFGRPLGPVPEKRAATNGVIIRKGLIVAEFGDTKAVDPMYSAAKSFLATACGVAVKQGLIKDVNDPVYKYIDDGGYDSAHNRKVTWKHHLQQHSEWEGALWGKKSDFIGHEEFGNGERKPRQIQEPGSFYEYNDVRVNRFSLSLLRLFRNGLHDVLKENIMDPIGASGTWRWHGYANSKVELGGRKLESVSGGTRWGGGLWMNSEDMARFGLLILNQGRWGNKQLLPANWMNEATQPSAHGPDYGYLWWLNTKGKQWPSAPRTAFAAVGNGSNIIWIDPEHDIVFVWRWLDGRKMDPVASKILASIRQVR